MEVAVFLLFVLKAIDDFVQQQQHVSDFLACFFRDILQGLAIEVRAEAKGLSDHKIKNHPQRKWGEFSVLMKLNDRQDEAHIMRLIARSQNKAEALRNCLTRPGVKQRSILAVHVVDGTSAPSHSSSSPARFCDHWERFKSDPRYICTNCGSAVHGNLHNLRFQAGLEHDLMTCSQCYDIGKHLIQDGGPKNPGDEVHKKQTLLRDLHNKFKAIAPGQQAGRSTSTSSGSQESDSSSSSLSCPPHEMPLAHKTEEPLAPNFMPSANPDDLLQKLLVSEHRPYSSELSSPTIQQQATGSGSQESNRPGTINVPFEVGFQQPQIAVSSHHYWCLRRQIALLQRENQQQAQRFESLMQLVQRQEERISLLEAVQPIPAAWHSGPQPMAQAPGFQGQLNGQLLGSDNPHQQDNSNSDITSNNPQVPMFSQQNSNSSGLSNISNSNNGNLQGPAGQPPSNNDPFELFYNDDANISNS
eukprot:m.94830 g.94830  ORF g.94830 m.94830 type:complete len:472 (-) comp21885_c0_seq1:53-1468(-)